ncbi:hypothetical protein DYB25_005629 [Aphanomyces astaci]|uniref:Uncharacterized protein n=1 Tax=Aphanomyces astaci TaxID=112090 RepID=A0A397BM04_APHAT|nr:hypothetical protein DYB25_005629 [Aphanomyces astaci]
MMEPSPEKADTHHEVVTPAPPANQIGDTGVTKLSSEDVNFVDDDDYDDGAASILPLPPYSGIPSTFGDQHIEPSSLTMATPPPPPPVQVNDSLDLEWNVQSSFDMPDKLCQEIQSAVDAAATRLATAAVPPTPLANGLQETDTTAELLLIMEVVIGDGRTESIQVREGDEAEALAATFALVHSLDPDVVPTLTAHISEQIRSIRPIPLTRHPSSKPQHNPPPATEKERSYNALRDKFGKSSSKSTFDLVKTTTPSPKGGPTARRGQPPASERLYALAQAQREWRARAQKKREDEVTKELADKRLQLADKTKLLVANRTNGQYRSIGERLYGEAVSENARRKKLADARSVEKAHADLIGDDQADWMCPKCACSNRYQDAKCQHSVGPVPKPTMFQPTLLSKENKKPVPNATLVLRRQKHEEVAKTEYNQRHPFAPQVNPTSTDLVKDKRTGATTHLTLYADADARRTRQKDHEAAYLAQFSFRPNIGINAFVAPPASKDALVQRLAIEDQQKLAQSRAKLFEKYGAAKDPATGRPYFTPETGRGPQFARNDTNLPIGTFLYQSRREFDEIHRQLRQADSDALRDHRTQSFVSKTSKMHLKARKVKSFDRIFKLLQQASTSTATVEKDESLLDPTLLQMDTLSLELGHVALSLFDTCGWVPIPKDNFYACMESTLAQCRHLTHTQVLFFGDKQTPVQSSPSHAIPTTKERADAADDQELTLHPKICAKSHQMVTKNTGRKKVFESLYNVHATYAAKRKQREAKLEKENAKTCTFRPQLCKQSFHDMYARLPDDQADDMDYVVLSTARPFEIVDMYIAELYLMLAMEGQHNALKTYRLPDASRILQRVPYKQRGSTSLPFPHNELWLLEVLCHSILEQPSVSSDESSKLFTFCDGFSTQLAASRPDLRMYFVLLHVLLLFRTGDVVRAGPLVQELETLTQQYPTLLPSTWRHLPALLHLQVNAYYNPTAAISMSSSLLSALQSDARDSPPFLWFDAHLTICHLLDAQGRYGEVGHLATELLRVVDLPNVARSGRHTSMRTAVHILLAKYAHAVNCMDDAINHVNAAFALILEDTPQWPQLSDVHLMHMMGLLEVATAISCFPLPKAGAPPAVVQPFFPDDNLLEFAAGVLRDTNLRALIYNGPSKEVRAKWLWGTQCLGLVGTYPDMDTLRSYMLSVLQDCLELSTSSINCSNITAEIMVLFGPKLIEFGRLDEGERTLTNALKIAMHTKNLKLQVQIMIEVHASCGRKDQVKAQSVVADKFAKKLESLARKVDRALENHAVHTQLLTWKVQETST